MTNYDVVTGDVKACVEAYLEGKNVSLRDSTVDALKNFSEGSFIFGILDNLQRARVLSNRGEPVNGLNSKLREMISGL